MNDKDFRLPLPKDQVIEGTVLSIEMKNKNFLQRWWYCYSEDEGWERTGMRVSTPALE